MKKIFIVFLLSFAAAKAMAADSYMGIHISQSEFSVRFADSSTQTWRGGGYGIMVGAALAQGFGFELAGGGVRLGLSSVVAGIWSASWADNYNLMLSGKYMYEILGFFRPYVGAGIGPSYWVNENSNYTYYYILSPGGGFSSGTTHSEKTERLWNFAYQARVGTSFNFTKYFDLDFAMTVKNLGRIPGGGILFNPTGDVWETAARVGVLWKY